MVRLLALLAAVAVTAAAPAAAGAAPGFFVAGAPYDGVTKAEGAAATAIALHDATPVPTADGGFLILDAGAVLRVNPLGVTSVVAKPGTGKVPGPAAGAKFAARDVAQAADGSVLIADGRSAVLRVTQDGRIAYAAGGSRAGFSGDGGLAVAALLHKPTDLAIQADGGYLIADAANDRVRRVAPDGVITTVAGSNATASDGDGGPATAAGLSSPRSVATAADGGFVIADSGDASIRRVAPDGTITTTAGTNDPEAPPAAPGGSPATSNLATVGSVAVAPDGALLISDRDGQHGLLRSAGGPFELVDADARAFGVESDGGLLLSTGAGASRIRWLPGSAPARLAVTIEPATLMPGARQTAHFASTLAGSAEIVVRHGKNEVARFTTPVQAGENAAVLPVGLKPGVAHQLTVTVTTADGRIATDTTGLLSGGPLPRGLATAIALRLAAAGTPDDEQARITRCKRFSRVRVDCSYGVRADGGDDFPCVGVYSIFLPANGRIFARTRACPLKWRSDFDPGKTFVTP